MSQSDDQPQAMPDLTTLAKLAGEWVEVVEAASVGVFEAEVEAMQALIAPKPPEDAEAHEARARAEQAAIEEGFDNLPV